MKTSHLKLGITVTVVLPMVGLGGAWAQVMVEGGTDRSLLVHPCPANVMSTSTKSHVHWQTSESMIAFLEEIQTRSGRDQHTLALLDCAPLHRTWVHQRQSAPWCRSSSRSRTT
eukprot:3010179-Amphidinium_carterae.1